MIRFLTAAAKRFMFRSQRNQWNEQNHVPD